MVGREGTGGRRAAPAPPGPSSLTPPWTPAATAAAILVTVVVTGLVWHSTRLSGPDAWVLHLLGAHSGERQFRLATWVAAGLRALTLGGIVATVLVSWMALRRWNAVALAVLAPAATLAVDVEATGGPPGAGVNRLPLPVGPCGGRDRAGPQPGADPPAHHDTTAGQGARRAVCGAARVADGLGAPGRDGAPADRRRRRSVDGGGGDPGRRPAARSPLSSERTPQAPCPGSRGNGRTAG